MSLVMHSGNEISSSTWLHWKITKPFPGKDEHSLGRNTKARDLRSNG